MAIGQELLNVPMGEMIREMAFAIADAQIELDQGSMDVAEMMSGSRLKRKEDGSPDGDEQEDTRVDFSVVEKVGDKLEIKKGKLSMLELGFTPNFYQFIDTIIEVKITIKITRSHESETKTKRTQKKWKLGWGKMKVNTSQVDATYTSKYSYSAEGSSLLRTKLVPVPPPSILEDRIRELLEVNSTA